MSEQGPYSEFRYNINVPISFLQQQQQRANGILTRTRINNNINTRLGHNDNNNQTNTTSDVSPLLALPLPPSPTSADVLQNPNRRRDGRRRNGNNNHSHSARNTFATASLTRAIRNRVTTGTNDAFTMYRRAAGTNTGGSGSSSSTILPLHNANTTSNQHRTTPVSLGSDRDFIYGFLFGSMVGSCMLLWIWIPTVSYKQKLGILFGYALHITMNMIHKSIHGDSHDSYQNMSLSPDDMNYNNNNYQYSRNFLINDDTLQLGE